MTKPKTDHDYFKKQKDKAEQKLRYYQHRRKCWSTEYQNSPARPAPIVSVRAAGCWKVF